MRNRSTKKQEDKIAEKATGRVGAFPYHRAAEAVRREQTTKAELNERENKAKMSGPQDRLPAQH